MQGRVVKIQYPSCLDLFAPHTSHLTDTRESAEDSLPFHFEVFEVGVLLIFDSYLFFNKTDRGQKSTNLRVSGLSSVQTKR
jgi:hypothetical protein